MTAFELRYGERALHIVQDSTTKSAMLLAILLYHAREGIAREKLQELLYGDGEQDAANSLKALVFRTRKRLGEIGLPEMEYILFQDGRYCFTQEMPVESDVGQLERLYAQAGAAHGAEKTLLLEQVCKAYRGELLPKLSTEMWVALENARLTDLYADAVRLLTGIYFEERAYEKAHALNQQAARFFPFEEEWYVAAINSLIRLGRNQQALDEYEAVTSLLFDEMGVYPSERLMNCARAISGKVLFSTTAASDVDVALKENGAEGAYYCSYPSFVDSYRILRRIMTRDGIRSSLVLCSIVDGDGRPVEDKRVLTPAIQRLRIALSQALRRSDMYTRYSGSQMLAMLWEAPPEKAEIGIRRINDAYLGQGGVCTIQYTVLSGDEPPRPIVSAKLRRESKRWKKLPMPDEKPSE